MRRISLLCSLAILFVLTGCHDGYHSYGFNYGYSTEVVYRPHHRGHRHHGHKHHHHYHHYYDCDY